MELQGYIGFIVNVHETSTGVHYDMEMISDFCKRNQLVLVVDAISSFLADPIHMEEMRIDVLITGSQKALACPPGISVIVLSQKAVERVEKWREAKTRLCRRLAYYVKIGDLADKIFRVGHIGDLTTDDNTVLINALQDLQKRGIL